MIYKLLTLAACGISALAVIYGAVRLFVENTPRYLQLYILAAACYFMEGLWTVCNSFFGLGTGDGLLSIRLVGLFGCFCFMLSANANEFDGLVDERRGEGRRARRLSLMAPVVLTAVLAGYIALNRSALTPLRAAILFFSFLPALPASYYNLKHLLLPMDTMRYLERTRKINFLALLFYTGIFSCVALQTFAGAWLRYTMNVFLSCVVLCISVVCVREAAKWKAAV